MVILEVIASCLEDAKIAEQSGADRIELITGAAEGGLTPSYGLIEEVVHSVSIPAHVMVRPHSRSFHYGEDDLRTMVKDIEMIRKIGASGVVIGALTSGRKVDVHTLEVLLHVAEEMDVTFHRAFDEAENQKEALELLLAYPQIKRILTSGGKQSALDAVTEIAELIRLTSDTHLSILPGSGLTVESLSSFIQQTSANQVHLGSAVRFDNRSTELIDSAKVAAAKQILASITKE